MPLNPDTITLLDGAMGTMLQRSGLKPGEIPEIKNITDPDMVRAVYRAYAEAGSQGIGGRGSSGGDWVWKAGVEFKF